MARATLIGFSAVAMWALLALLTDASGAVPPFLLSAITFAIGTCVGLAARLVSPRRRARRKDPVAGLADRHCGPVRLPLLLFHRAAQRAGGGGQPDRLSVAAAHRARLGADAGREAALESCRRRAARACRHGADRHQGRRRFPSTAATCSAMRWPASAPSSGRPIRCCRGAFPTVPTSIVTWFCAATSALSLACHFALEETVLPQGAGQWLAVLGLGLMPVGAAFYAWDHGVKRGNIQVLGAASYAAPLLSTLVLIATGFAEPSLAHPGGLPADHRRRRACGEIAAVRPRRRGSRRRAPDAVRRRHRGHLQRHADPVGRRGGDVRHHRQHQADAGKERGEDARRRRCWPCWSSSKAARCCCSPRLR